MLKKNRLHLISVLRVLALPLGVLAIAGCYTQFATLDRYEQSAAQPKEEIIVDSTGDTVKVVREKDTVWITDRQVRYWDRDMFGRPRLRSYMNFYDSDWSSYSYRPWWSDNYYYSDYYYPYNSYDYPFSYDYWYYRDYRNRHHHLDDYDGNASDGTSHPGGGDAGASIDISGGRGGDGTRSTYDGARAPLVGPRPQIGTHVQTSGSTQPTGSGPVGSPSGNYRPPQSSAQPSQSSGGTPRVESKPAEQKNNHPADHRRFGRRR